MKDDRPRLHSVRRALQKGPEDRTDEDIDVISEFVKETESFAVLTPAQQRAVCQLMTWEEHPAKSCIFNYGDPGDKYYVILMGMVAVMKPSEGAPCPVNLHTPEECTCPERPLRNHGVLEAGMGFGELALTQNQPRAATIQAIDLTELLVLKRHDYEKHAVAMHRQHMDDRLNFLMRCPRIQDAFEESIISKTDLSAIANMLNERKLYGNEVACWQGQPLDELIMVRSGTLMILRAMECGDLSSRTSTPRAPPSRDRNSPRRPVTAPTSTAPSSPAGSRHPSQFVSSRAVSVQSSRRPTQKHSRAPSHASLHIRHEAEPEAATDFRWKSLCLKLLASQVYHDSGSEEGAGSSASGSSRRSSSSSGRFSAMSSWTRASGASPSHSVQASPRASKAHFKRRWRPPMPSPRAKREQAAGKAAALRSESRADLAEGGSPLAGGRSSLWSAVDDPLWHSEVRSEASESVGHSPRRPAPLNMWSAFSSPTQLLSLKHANLRRLAAADSSTEASPRSQVVPAGSARQAVTPLRRGAGSCCSRLGGMQQRGKAMSRSGRVVLSPGPQKPAGAAPISAVVMGLCIRSSYTKGLCSEFVRSSERRRTKMSAAIGRNGSTHQLNNPALASCSNSTLRILGIPLAGHRSFSGRTYKLLLTRSIDSTEGWANRLACSCWVGLVEATFQTAR